MDADAKPSCECAEKPGNTPYFHHECAYINLPVPKLETTVRFQVCVCGNCLADELSDDDVPDYGGPDYGGPKKPLLIRILKSLQNPHDIFATMQTVHTLDKARGEKIG